VRHWERRIYAICWEFCDLLFVTDISKVFTVDGADSEHFLLLNSELLKLTSILLRVRLRSFVKLDNRNAFLTVHSDLLLEVLVVIDGHVGLLGIVH